MLSDGLEIELFVGWCSRWSKMSINTQLADTGSRSWNKKKKMGQCPNTWDVGRAHKLGQAAFIPGCLQSLITDSPNRRNYRQCFWSMLAWCDDITGVAPFLTLSSVPQVRFSLSQELAALGAAGEQDGLPEVPKDHPFTMQGVGGQTMAVFSQSDTGQSQSAAAGLSFLLGAAASSWAGDSRGVGSVGGWSGGGVGNWGLTSLNEKLWNEKILTTCH